MRSCAKIIYVMCVYLSLEDYTLRASSVEVEAVLSWIRVLPYPLPALK